MSLKKISRQEQAGFTIIELMIATLVFSVILLIITTGIIGFTTSYYRGVNASTIQNTARTISDTISQAIQFSGDAIQPTTPGGTYFCAGGKVYSYSLGTRYSGLTPSAANPGLYQQDEAGGICPASAPGFPGVNGSELLGTNMRLSNLAVTSLAGPLSTKLYSVKIRIVYGEDDMMCSPSLIGSCRSATTLSVSQLRSTDLKCKPQQGSQFCGVSELSTTVQTRLNE